jgi:integrase
VTMNDLFDLYEAECIPRLQWRSQRDYRSIIIILRRAFGHKDVVDMRPKDVAEFINVPTGRVHRNRMVTILSTVFKKAMGRWCLDLNLTNPCTVIERWPTSPRERYVSTKEFLAFRATCRPQFQIAMDLARVTSQRQGDLLGLKWSQIKTENLPRDQWHIEIDQGKSSGRKKLAVELSEQVEKILDRAWLMEPHWPREYVLRTKHGLRYTEDGFRAEWQRRCRAWEAAGHERFHFHDLRAKAVSDNPDMMAASLLAGHQNSAITRRIYDRNRRFVKVAVMSDR